MAACAAAAVAFAACGGAEEQRKAVEPVVTSNPAAAFAPLVRLDAREEAWPISAAYFLDHAGLEWVGPCGYDQDVTETGVPVIPPRPVKTASDLPLDPKRLGRVNVYRSPPDDLGCGKRSTRVYTSDQHTTPRDKEDRPLGLGSDEGFTLDIDGEVNQGKRRLASDGSLAGVPVYYAREAAGRAGVRISYWLMFGEQGNREGPRDWAWSEGDWERVDVLARRGRGRRAFRPVAVEYRVGERTRRLPWDEVELAGPGASHPVVYLTRFAHTAGSARTCDRCIDWKTWRLTRDVRDEPWWGYGGAWGSFQPSLFKDGTSLIGVSGPSPYEIRWP